MVSGLMGSSSLASRCIRSTFHSAGTRMLQPLAPHVELCADVRTLRKLTSSVQGSMKSSA